MLVELAWWIESQMKIVANLTLENSKTTICYLKLILDVLL
jgi:hypothetical protein